MVDLTTFCRKSICCWMSNPRRGITIAWIISLVLVFIAFIVACIAAASLRTQESQSGGQAAGFAAVWTSLLLIALSIVGTIIMRRYKSSLSIGFFIGIVFIMANQMLILFAIFAERAKQMGRPEQKTMAVFAFFLFLIYAIFGTMLSVFRHDIVVNDDATDSGAPQFHDMGQELESPPEYK